MFPREGLLSAQQCVRRAEKRGMRFCPQSCVLMCGCVCVCPAPEGQRLRPASESWTYWSKSAFVCERCTWEAAKTSSEPEDLSPLRADWGTRPSSHLLHKIRDIISGAGVIRQQALQLAGFNSTSKTAFRIP